MIQILVIDDNEQRVEKIRAILEQFQECENGVCYVKTVLDAKRALLNTKYDIMLLDLVLPLLADSAPQSSGGIDLLREIVHLDQYNLPSHVLVISEFETALVELSSISNEVVFSPIKYDATSDEWSVRLISIIKQFLRAETPKEASFDYDVAIICALETPELHEVKRLPYNWEPYNLIGDATDYFDGSYNGRKLICAAAYEMGMSASAVLATKMVEKFKPRYLVMTGIAGAVQGKANYGDVMVADPCFDYESGKKVIENGASVFKPDYKQIRLDNTINQVIRRIAGQSDALHAVYNDCTYEKPDNGLKIITGPFGSGAAVLSDINVINRVLQHDRKFMGFDMEAYAVMLAGALASAPKPTAIVMKSVSDFGEGKTDIYQKYAAYTSARALDILLKELFK